MDDKIKGYIAAFLYAIIIGLVFLFTKAGVMMAGPIQLMAYRFFISFAIIYVLKIFKFIKLDLKNKNIKPLIVISLFFPSGFFFFQSFALKYAKTSEAGIVNALVPIIVLILSMVFLKEKVNKKQILFLMLSVFGVFYIFFIGGNSISKDSTVGIIYMFVGVISFSIFNILVKKYSKDYTTIEITYVMQAVGFVLFFIMSMIFDRITLNKTIALFSNMDFIISILYMSVLSTLITAILNNYALSKLDASKVGAFANLATIVTIASGAIFLGEKLFSYHYIGSFFIIIGVLGMNIFSNKNNIKQKKII